MKKILVGITTTHDSNWREKISDIDRLEISEAALFPTTLEKKERSEYFKMLSKSNLKRAPHVHIRDDMDENDLDFLSERFKTQLFNIHPDNLGLGFINKISDKYKAKLYVENTGVIDKFFYECLGKIAGVCFDASHYYDYWSKQKREDYKKLSKLIDNYKIGCCHISAITERKKYIDYGGQDKWHYNKHTFSDLSEFDYLLELKQYLPDIISLELENSLEEQLEVKKYIEENILK